MFFFQNNIRRGKPVKYSINDALIDTSIVPGTKLTLKTYWNHIFPGPRYSLDICSSVAQNFPDSNYTCPISSYGIKLIFLSMQQFHHEKQGFVIPSAALPGKYKAFLELKSPDSKITCAKTTLIIE
jgi:hypothetical protein